jgi:cytoskeleton protein RodZ
MRHELDVADVEARTKIRAKYLRALENEEFGVLPGPTTVRSFIRTYAELLGLDPHPLVEEYRARNEDREEVELQPVPATPRGSDRRERRERRERRPSPPPRVGRGGPSPLAVIAGTVLLILVALAIIGLIGGEEGGGERASQDGDTTQARRQPKPKPKKGTRPATSTVATLNVAPTVPTYVCLDTGPGTKILFEGTLDSTRRFRAKRVRLNLGRTSAKLTANGKAVPLEPSPTPVGYDVTPTRVQELEPGQRPCA